MASIFWDPEGVVLVDYLDKGHTITVAYYDYLLIQIREKIKQTRCRKLTRGVLFHQNNVPAYTSTVVMAATQKCGFQLVENPLYSSDLAPSDYYLFLKMTKELGGYQFPRVDEVMNAVDYFLRDQNGALYTDGIRLLDDRWSKCVNLGGDYVGKWLHLIF